MAYQIAQIKQDLTGIMHGTDLGKIQGLNRLLERAARDVVLDIDLMETRRTQELGLLFDDVYEVAVPEDVKGNKNIDIRTVEQSRRWGNPNQVFTKEFELYKGYLCRDLTFSVRHNSGIKTLRIDSPLPKTGIVVNSLDSVDENGAWGTVNDATNIVTDPVNRIQGSGSVRFDVDGATGNAGIVNTLTESLDLTVNEGIGSFFFHVYIPNKDEVQSVQLVWGSGPTDIFRKTVATDSFGNAFKNGWNQLRVDWDNVSTVGAPDASVVNRLEVNIAYTAGVVIDDFRVDRITLGVGVPYEIEYYSKYLFYNDNGFSDRIVSDNDFILLDTESLNIFLYKVAQHAFQQQHDYGTSPGLTEVREFENLYERSKQRYKDQYKSEVIKPQQNYYRSGRRGYDDYRFNRYQ